MLFDKQEKLFGLHIWPFQVAALVPQYEVDHMIGSTFLDVQSLKMTQAQKIHYSLFQSQNSYCFSKSR